MWIVRLPSQPPCTFVLAIGVLSIFRTPTDISPHINIPVVSITSSFNGMVPKDGRHERTHTSHPEEEATKPPASSLLLGFPDTDYPLQGKTIVVTRCGCICLDKKTINFSQVFA